MTVLLQRLYRQFDACKRCRLEGNPLRHILGGGEIRRPQFLFLFINPTHHNISSHEGYEGTQRFPFLGVRYFYKVMAAAGFIDQGIVDSIYSRGWNIADEEALYASWKKSGVYVTNLVKCTQPHPENPARKVIDQDLPLLMEEISLINPRYIVTFGKLPTKVLTGVDVKLGDYLDSIRKRKYEPLASLPIKRKTYPVLPCFFPVGRGNPPKAIEILQHIRAYF